MQYRTDPKSGNRLSVLGFGCMRLSRNPVQIDYNKAEKLIVQAISAGINYFDCAYAYPGSEETLGRVLRDNGLRDHVYIATKLPHYKCRQNADFDRLFATQLDRLKSDHIDYYLIHSLPSPAVWQRLCDLGIKQWLAEKLSLGQIRQIGFSFHGNHQDFLTLLDSYDWDFCMIQYNYVNEHYQAGVDGLKRAAAKGMPVMIMEPLLGGRLATGLPKQAAALFAAYNPQLSPAGWALRWLWDQSEVCVVLSGMNNAAQLTENLALAGTAQPHMLSDEEKSVFSSVRHIFDNSYKIPCTGCNYCLPCPQGVNIPGCFAAFNMYHAVSRIAGIMSYVTGIGGMTDGKAGPSRCIQCGVCAQRCPQNIDIPAELTPLRKRMEPFWLRAGFALMSVFRK